MQKNSLDSPYRDNDKMIDSVSYQITKNDYIATAKLARTLTVKRSFLYLLWLVTMSIMAWHLSNKALLAVLIVLMVGIMYLVLAHKLIVPWIAGRDYERHKTMHAPLSIKIVKNGLSIERRGTLAVLYWDELFKWQENDQYILLYTMPRIFHIVPKRISEQGFDIGQLRDYLNQKVSSGYKV